MGKAGQLFAINFGGIRVFKMLPWVFGIYEFQLGRLNKEFALLVEEYATVFQTAVLFPNSLTDADSCLLKKKYPARQEVISYEKISDIIEQNQSFLVNDCVCKKEKALLGHPCDRPVQVCLAIAPVPGVFEKYPTGQEITKHEAHDLMKNDGRSGAGPPDLQCAGRRLLHL